METREGVLKFPALLLAAMAQGQAAPGPDLKMIVRTPPTTKLVNLEPDPSMCPSWLLPIVLFLAA